ncbi:MAG: hypothetical protein NNA21_02345 [Nitrospira sp.]|nr:hypothetical protein [Nitrospira sp.]MCP9461053.1 hypothetical protein [Nitrospira sp.]MCP9474040.1 hypothetical protein [Nitrospira sp.]
METAPPFSGHVIGLLKTYMQDLVEQAVQEGIATEQFGFSPTPYRPYDAISDLLALLDDRIESEGIQVGLPETFLHSMWSLCDEVAPHVHERVWMEENISGEQQRIGKAKTREMTYRVLIELIERRSR